MSVTLSFTDKNNKPATITFPNRQVAEVYARGVKNPTFTDSDTVVVATVTKCGSMEDEERKRKQAAEAEAAECAEEAYMEEGVQTRLQGGSTSEALDNAARASFHARGIALARIKKTRSERVCGCGKSISGDSTACYTCRRYR